MNESNDKREKGKALARIILKGAERGPRVPKKFADYSLEHLFGDLWQGEELSLEERSLVTCTILVALNREAEQRIHFRAAKNIGLPRQRIEGMITHAAHYAGWPVAASAFRVLAEVWPEDEAEDEN
jgi:4-carboxymuconolactone decarboxylase